MSLSRDAFSVRSPLTPADLDLLATPDEDLQARAYVFGFDLNTFEARLRQGDLWQQLMQASLYFEHVLNQVVTEALVKPKAIRATRMSFAQKLELSQALALLPDQLMGSMSAIIKLRNKVAHELNFALDDHDIANFANSVPKYLREMVVTETGRVPGPIQLHELLRVLLLQIEVIRQGHALNRLRSRKAQLRLRTVLERTPGVSYRE